MPRFNVRIQYVECFPYKLEEEVEAETEQEAIDKAYEIMDDNDHYCSEGHRKVIQEIADEKEYLE